MKVGIMSMQRIKNYGSFLQAFGLKKIIESLSHDVEFVDYHIGQCVCEKQAEKKQNKIKQVIRFIKHRSTPRKRNMYKKANQFGAVFDTFFVDLGLTDKRNYNANVDTLIIGSDEVFNCFQDNLDVGYSLELFGKNNSAKKCITYAASFGSTTMEKISSYNKQEEIGYCLGSIDSISVRDNNSFEIVKTLTNKAPDNINLDPVLVYDFSEEIIEPEISEPYIIVYSYRGRFSSKEGKFIKKFATQKGMKLLSLGGIQDFCDDYILATPFEVLGLIKNAGYVITDTFHGTVFSIKFNKKFVSVIRDSNKQKLSDLLLRFGLSERELEDFNKLNEQIDKEYDIESVNRILEEEKLNTHEYLVRNIGN